MQGNLYLGQRAMRERREAALKKGIVAIVDLGTDKINCMIVATDATLMRAPRVDGIGRLDGHAGMKVIGAANTMSRGIEYGEIVEMDEVERGLRTVVQTAQKMADVRVDHVIACFSGGRPRSYGLLGEAKVTHGEVTEADVGEALDQAEVPPYGAGREVIHALPVNYTLDARTGLSDPRGLTGNALSVDMHMMTVSTATVQNLMTVCRRCSLELSGVVHSSYAAGLSAMTEDELELGGACIDMGAGSTGISVFMKRQMIFADSIPFGGAQVTNDICQGLIVSTAHAERIKTFHGGLVATSADDRDLLEIPRDPNDDDAGRRTVSRAELIGIMRPRLEETLEAVRDSLDAASFDHMPGRRIVLTGGASLVPGMEEVAGRILGRQVRLGRPLRIPGLPGAQTVAQFSASVGMGLYLARPQDECWDYEVPADRSGAQRFRKALRWFRESW
ncbi:cell division protein FtsA [Pontivivens insulae]|uniref:Cell division protein FtsA n=1 Tax=Pontivivens insulae TaxID=1639689 RepID=A0A2R8ADZ7_9RHOB|nr:cell division protein FtsA [Pontivivens insulae]RED14215.1 cell division protein FtsA [Pontivivens insulae]SPF30290.1 Cell division protein FtsA [Pontivivens insulae]